MAVVGKTSLLLATAVVNSVVGTFDVKVTCGLTDDEGTRYVVVGTTVVFNNAAEKIFAELARLNNSDWA